MAISRNTTKLEGERGKKRLSIAHLWADTVTVIHHVEHHGRRYEVDSRNKRLLGPLTTSAREIIVSWMKQPSSQVDAETIAELSTYYSSVSSDAEDKLRYISNGSVIEKYYSLGEEKAARKPGKKNPSAKSKPRTSARTKRVTGKKLSKPTTFHKFPMPACKSENVVSMTQSYPLVAILSGSTSRSETKPSNSTLSLFTIMLPSLMRSLDCGFRYLVVIGYDKGDKFYDSAKVSQ